MPIRWEALWVPQLHDGYCLPASLQIALAALEISVSQQRLAQVLGTSDAGTPFSRIVRLSSFGVTVQYGTGGTLALLSDSLATDAIVIAAVHAG